MYVQKNNIEYISETIYYFFIVKNNLKRIQGVFTFFFSHTSYFVFYSTQLWLIEYYICMFNNYANQRVMPFGDKMSYIVIYIVSGNKISCIWRLHFCHIAKTYIPTLIFFGIL